MRISHRLAQDHKIVKKAPEKESWAGIPKMNLDSLDPNSAYRSYSLSGMASPNSEKRLKSGVLTKQQQRDAKRKEIIRDIQADAKLHR